MLPTSKFQSTKFTSKRQFVQCSIIFTKLYFNFVKQSTFTKLHSDSELLTFVETYPFSSGIIDKRAIRKQYIFRDLRRHQISHLSPLYGP